MNEAAFWPIPPVPPDRQTHTQTHGRDVLYCGSISGVGGAAHIMSDDYLCLSASHHANRDRHVIRRRRHEQGIFRPVCLSVCIPPLCTFTEGMGSMAIEQPAGCRTFCMCVSPCVSTCTFVCVQTDTSETIANLQSTIDNGVCENNSPPCGPVLS